ncbi:MAG TPA: DUF3616 domain-containing protein [Sedimenticola sp.]|nr:DUF3616 domain-containing protein [Sedimenticola sp.]
MKKSGSKCGCPGSGGAPEPGKAENEPRSDPREPEPAAAGAGPETQPSSGEGDEDSGLVLQPSAFSLKKQKKCSPRVKHKKTKAGTARGLETLIRSLYRTHLDLTMVADNKAGMMITINGLIISILLASGGSLVAVTENYLYMLPIIILLISGFISLLYTVISARPSTDRCCDATKRPADFLQGKANVMYFMDNADLEQHEYVAVMKEIMEDKNQVYEEMFMHVHSMSVVLKNKFSLLRTAYTVFIIGLGICIASFILVVVISMFDSTDQESASGVEAETAGFRQFAGDSDIFEPSGVQQLPDGRFIIAQDEADWPFSLLTLRPHGDNDITHLAPKKIFSKGGAHKRFRVLDDLEGLAVDDRGYVYAVTSHSRAADGDSRKNREKLVRFRIHGDKILDPVVVTGLRKELIGDFPELGGQTAGNGFNIEGLCLNRTRDKLLLGFRAPLDKKGNALVAVIDDPDALFSGRRPPRIRSALVRLNLNGSAIRGMAYDPLLQGYLIIGGSPGKRASGQNRLWFWNGAPEASPRLVLIRGLDGLENAEGVSPARIGGEKRILVVSDDGNEKSGKTARYLLLGYDQLQIL